MGLSTFLAVPRIATATACALSFLLVPGLGACGGDGERDTSTAGATSRLQVVTTVAPITSIVANIAGDLVDIQGVVPEGTNSNAALLYQASTVLSPSGSPTRLGSPSAPGPTLLVP